MVLVLSFLLAFGIELFNSITSSNIDEYFKLKSCKIVPILRKKLLIYRFTCRTASPKSYYSWLLSQKKFNEAHVSKHALVFQCIMHGYALYNLILGFIMVDSNVFENIPNIYWYLGVIPSAVILLVMMLIAPTIFYILLDKEIAKRFPKDSN